MTRTEPSDVFIIRDSETSVFKDPKWPGEFIHNKGTILGIITNKNTQAVFNTLLGIINAFAEFINSIYKPLNKSHNNYYIIGLNKITNTDLISTTRKLKNKNSCYLDGIPSFIINDCIHSWTTTLYF